MKYSIEMQMLLGRLNASLQDAAAAEAAAAHLGSVRGSPRPEEQRLLHRAKIASDELEGAARWALAEARALAEAEGRDTKRVFERAALALMPPMILPMSPLDALRNAIKRTEQFHTDLRAALEKARPSGAPADRSDKPSVGAIPAAVLHVVAKELYDFYSHDDLNLLFPSLGAPGAPPDGSKLTKIKHWLRRADADLSVDGLRVLGGLIEAYMDAPLGSTYSDTVVEWAASRGRIQEVLGQFSLTYEQGGRIGHHREHAAARRLEEIIRRRDLAGMDAEFRRAMSAVENDPPAALTAACSLLEALFKAYIESTEQLELPSKLTVGPLWKVVRRDLGLNPAGQEDRDLQAVLGGLGSVVNGLGALRTHAGSAHGRGRTRYRVTARHARVAVGAAQTLAVFLLETWEARTAAGG